MNRYRNTLAFRFQTAYIQGFGGTSSPFYQRFFMGGDFDIRGFDFRSISPIAFVTRTTFDSFTGQPIQSDDIAYVGGDTMAVANLEYRIPLGGPMFTLAPFVDAGNSWVTRKGQLAREVVQPDGTIQKEEVRFLPGTNSGIRLSTGIELQVMMPVINAPFRLIYGFNPLRLNRVVTTPTTGQKIFLREEDGGFKFTIGRTF